MNRGEKMEETNVKDNQTCENTEVEDTEVEETGCEDKKETKKEKKAKKKEAKLEEEIERLSEELAETQNMYYKAYADTENLKKRLQNDADTLRKYRIQSFAQEILPAIDNLERVMATEIEDEAMQSYVGAVNMIYQQLMLALEKEGVSAIESKDKPFDPNVHHALVMEKVEGVEPGIVVEEIQKGYMLKDRVLRASLVKVSE